MLPGVQSSHTHKATGGGPHPANCVEVLASPPPPADQSLGVQIALQWMRLVKMRPRWSRVSRDPIAPCLYKRGKLDNSGQTHVGTGTMPCDPGGRLEFRGEVGRMYKARNAGRPPEAGRRGADPSRPSEKNHTCISDFCPPDGRPDLSAYANARG